MFRKIIFIFLLFGVVTTYSSPAYAAAEEPVYTQLRSVDIGTFNEYRYKITDEFFVLRNKHEINETIDAASAGRILELAQKGYNYLPDSLSNKNYYNQLKTSIERGIKYPNNDSNYTSILTDIDNYLEKTNIQTIKGTVEAFPQTGNAPLNVTLRGKVADPTGTQIPSYNYTWWIYQDGVKKILGNNISMNYLFKEEGNFSVFLDVSSAHKNEKGYTDVLPFSSRADITIKEKIASVIIKVNSISLRNDNEIKFNPEEARYGLLFDATSSTATSGSTFIQTSWDFGNGVKKEYTGDPKVERVVYAKEGDFTVTLKLKTNELKQVERKFIVSIHDPIATIKSSQEEGFLGDKFTFSAQSSGKDKDLSYAWEIIDLNRDEIILRKSGSLFTYLFNEKGKYNVKMMVTDPSGETDVDSKIIYINSRPPNAEFTSAIPFKNKPNKVFLDATKSFDPDFSDDGKLKYSWLIDGNRIELEEPNFNGSAGYFTFDSIGDHSVVLTVEDPDGISSQKKDKVLVKSILSVDLYINPRVTQRLTEVRFIAESPTAKFYEWNFGDGKNSGGKDDQIDHEYEKSGVYDVKLTVKDENNNQNEFSKNVYIGESDAPYSFISIKDSLRNDIVYSNDACDGKGAYIVNRVDIVSFSGDESVDITGKNDGLTYSWKLGRDSYKNSQDFTRKFDELGCFPIKLTVKSNVNGKTHSTTSYVDVRNLKPVLSSIDIRVENDSTDPVIINLDAIGAQDKDGVIQSYLWYYYTDADSEPQDFRATKLPGTSFVLPKITGNYYFVVVMKDNNEEKISSEEITDSKYFITLTGDNLNTPLVKLTVDDSSIAIGDEITFTSNVENILGQDLSKKVKYSWDFDGDGFYDKESSSNVETYKYLTSGEKHVKVKVKYKGFSNVKSLTINVSNVLNPDFGYISILNKFIFYDESIGTSESIQWDLGDGTIINNKKYVIHTYEDGKAIHNVKLKISEGSKTKDIVKEVVKNAKNLMFARKGLLVLFSNFVITENKITLEEKGRDIIFYLGESRPNITNYVIDYDVEYDSDLNGSNDDDEDNFGLNSYTGGEPIKVILNGNKIQKIRLFTKNASGEMVDSRDITIIKNYIEEESVDVNIIVFEGVSESIKLKIEKLKEYVNALPKQHKLKALMYVQKLKEEWSDNREKTNVILEFESFIDGIGIENSDEIINLLEGLLVDGDKDQSEKAITFNALKNLLPTTIVCTDTVTGTLKQCYEEMVLKLEAIRDNGNIDENKILGTEILDAVATDQVMTDKQKTDFKAILKTLIYGGVENIPEVEKEEIINEDKSGTSSFLGLLLGIIKWIFYIILGFILIVAGYYIYFLLVNKNKNIGFQDFIIEKTSGIKHIKKKEDTGIEFDVLNELNNEKDNISKVVDIFDTETDKKQDKEAEIKTVSEPKKESSDKEGVPDWLKGSFSDVNTTEVKVEKKQEEEVNIEPVIEEKQEDKKDFISDEKIEEVTKIEDNNIPDWLKGSFSDVDTTEVKVEKEQEEAVSIEPVIEEKEEEIVEKEEKEEKEDESDIINDEKVEEIIEVKDDNIPDWLKGSFSDEKVPDTKESVSKKSDDNIPDWLKGSFVEDTKQVTTKKEEIIEKKPQIEVTAPTEKVKVPAEIKKVPTEIVKAPKEKAKVPAEIKKVPTEIVKVPKEKAKVPAITKKEDKVIEKKDTKPETKQEEIKQIIETTSKGTQGAEPNTNIELWDDGMKVPDWLKTDDEK